jgi:hypothetical protein
VFDDVAKGFAAGRLHARVEVHDTDLEPSAQVDGRKVPLESDTTAAARVSPRGLARLGF